MAEPSIMVSGPHIQTSWFPTNYRMIEFAL